SRSVSSSSSHFMSLCFSPFFLNCPAPSEIYTLSLHDALPICVAPAVRGGKDKGSGLRLGKVQGVRQGFAVDRPACDGCTVLGARSEEHTSELQSRFDLVCRLLLEKKKKK